MFALLAVKGRYHCPAFTAAFKDGRIVNEDDNYLLDEYERCAACPPICIGHTARAGLCWVTVRVVRLDELRETFLAKLDWEKCRTSPPFNDKDGKHWFDRCAKL